MSEYEDQQYARLVGERLRHVRAQQGLSLHDVEAKSSGELKASVLGAYERGERAVSIMRLRRLAEFYRVPTAELLPDHADQGRRSRAQETTEGGPNELVIDLVALEQRDDVDPGLVRYAEAIQSRRGDYNGRILTVRASDLEMFAAILDVSASDLRERLSEQGILR